MKLGCPIIPTTTLLMPADLRDRVERGDARVVITDPVFAERFEPMSDGVLRVLIRGSRAGWQTLSGAGSRDDVRSGGRYAGNGSTVSVLHFGDHRKTQARRSHARQLSHRAPVDHVLARPAAREIDIST